MNFNNKREALFVLSQNQIEVFDEEILFPRHASFIDEVHEAIEYLIDEHEFGIKYI